MMDEVGALDRYMERPFEQLKLHDKVLCLVRYAILSMWWVSVLGAVRRIGPSYPPN